MTKLDKLKQAEHLYVCEKQPLDVIGTKLDLSRRTLLTAQFPIGSSTIPCTWANSDSNLC